MELDPDAVTPEYQNYEPETVDEDDDASEDGGPRDRPQPVPDIDDVTPEQHDNYIGAEVNLPLRGTSTLR